LIQARFEEREKGVRSFSVGIFWHCLGQSSRGMRRGAIIYVLGICLGSGWVDNGLQRSSMLRKDNVQCSWVSKHERLELVPLKVTQES